MEMTENKNGKAIAYLRTSTDEQEIASQQIAVEKWIISEGYTEEQIIRVGKEGISACDCKDEYYRLFDEMEEHIILDNVKCIYAYCITRFVRMDESRFFQFINDVLIPRRIDLRIKENSLHLLDDNGKVNPIMEMALKIMSVMAKQQTSELKAQLKRGKDYNKSIGKSNGSNTVGYGYMTDEHNYIIPNPETAPIVKKVFELYATGNYSTFTLKKELEKEGIVLKAAHIRKMLARRKYCDNKPIQPLVSVELWERCKKIRQSNNSCYTKQSKHHNFGAGILKCPECGHAIIANPDAYYCVNRSSWERHDSKPCSNQISIRIKYVDSVLWHVARLCEFQELKARQNLNVTEVESRIKEIETRVENIEIYMIPQVETKKKRVVSAWVDGDFDDAEKSNRLNRIATEVNILKAEVADLNSEKAMLQAQLNSKDEVDFSGFFKSYIGLSEADEIKMQGIVKKHIKKAHIVETEKGRCLRMYMAKGDIAEVYLKGKSKVKYWIEVDGELQPLPIDTIIRTPDGIRIENGSNTNIIADALVYDKSVFDRFVA